MIALKHMEHSIILLIHRSKVDMAFKASKKRERRSPDRIGRGSPIIPSNAIAMAYRREMKGLCYAMIDDYQAGIAEWLEKKQVKKFFAQDSADSTFQTLMKRLQLKWAKAFARVGSKIAADFIKSVEKGATSATFASLKSAGIEAPKATYNKFVENTLKTSETFNTTLVTKVGEDIHNRVYEAVMLSLTSPDPAQQGTSGIQAALRNVKQFSAKRVDLIAKDQTSKLYCVLSDERMRQNGVEEFEWAHSGAGKESRISHEHVDGMRFKLDDKRLWEVGGELKFKKGDIGPPGWAIHCKCRKIPII